MGSVEKKTQLKIIPVIFFNTLLHMFNQDRESEISNLFLPKKDEILKDEPHFRETFTHTH